MNCDINLKKEKPSPCAILKYKITQILENASTTVCSRTANKYLSLKSTAITKVHWPTVFFSLHYLYILNFMPKNVQFLWFPQQTFFNQRNFLLQGLLGLYVCNRVAHFAKSLNFNLYSDFPYFLCPKGLTK